MSAHEAGTVIDVEARDVSNEHSAHGKPALEMLPALVAKNEIAKANPAIAQMQALVAKIQAELPKLDVNTKEGEARYRELRRECVSLRTGTKAAYESWNKPLLEAQRGVRSIVDQVTTGISAHEKTLDDAIKAKEHAAEEERKRKAEAEHARIAALRVKITAIAEVPADAVSLSSAEIDAKIRELQDLQITDGAESFGEFSDEATALRAQVVTKLLEMGAARRAIEDEAARLSALAAEQVERERQAALEKGLRDKIAGYQALALRVFGKSSQEIKGLLDELHAMEPLALEFGDIYNEAATTWAQTTQLIANAQKAQESIEAQQAEQQRIAAEQADTQRRLEAEERTRRETAEAQERAAAEAARQEEERRQRIQVRIDNLRMNGEGLEGQSCDYLIQVILDVNKVVIDQDSFGERVVEAEELRTQVLAKLGDAYTEAFQEYKRRAEEEERAAEARRVDERDRIAKLARALDPEAENFADIVDSVLQFLGDGDYPTEGCGDLAILELLTNENVQHEMCRRRDALLASQPKAPSVTECEEIPL